MTKDKEELSIWQLKQKILIMRNSKNPASLSSNLKHSNIESIENSDKKSESISRRPNDPMIKYLINISKKSRNLSKDLIFPNLNSTITILQKKHSSCAMIRGNRFPSLCIINLWHFWKYFKQDLSLNKISWLLWMILEKLNWWSSWMMETRWKWQRVLKKKR